MGRGIIFTYGAVLYITAFLFVVVFVSVNEASAGMPVVDGMIGANEYSNSALVSSTPDLGGVYDPGTSGSFSGGAVNCHSDWMLHWDFDATNIYFAADPLGAVSNCADTVISAHLLPTQGDPNVSADCTGTFFNLNFNNFHAAEACPFTFGGGFDEFDFGSIPPSSNWVFAQSAITTTITPIEWSIARADLNKFGDTTYTDSPDLECVWFRASAFDSRSVDNGAGPGARTIWLKFNPNEGNCTSGPVVNGFNNDGNFLIQNRSNRISVSGLTPKKKAVVIWGFRRGNGTVTTNNCGDIPIGIDPNQTLAILKANAGGNLNKKFFVPPTSASRAFFQVVDLASCAVSERMKVILLDD